jgi:hypothetical protein
MAELLARDPKNFELPFHAMKRARIEPQRFFMRGPAVARLFFEPQSREPVKLLLQSLEQLEVCCTLFSDVLEGRFAVDPKVPRSSPTARRAMMG